MKIQRKIKLRKVTKMFWDGKIMEPKFCIEAKHRTKWLLLGDNNSNGPLKFNTEKERDTYYSDLEKAIEGSGVKK